MIESRTPGDTVVSLPLPPEVVRRFGAAAGIANAVLYEGYVLYPYHAGNRKNWPSARFQWGVLVPPAWRQVDPNERSTIRTELIVAPGDEPRAAVRLRFLRLQRRDLEVADEVPDAMTGSPRFRSTEQFTVGRQVWTAWDEAIEERIDLGMIPLLPLAGATATVPFSFPGGREVEVVPGEVPVAASGTAGAEPAEGAEETVAEGADETAAGGPIAGRIIRTTEPIEGVVRLRAAWADGPGVLIKLTVAVENSTPWADATATREDMMRRSLLALHTLAVVENGSFCSLLDPPEGVAQAVAGCRNDGAYPVMMGEPGDTDLMLAPPIILYDYPQIAPESLGDFHDGCEIDEVLVLRVLTLTEHEKAQARGTDPRARAIIDRCDGMGPASWDHLHGALRDVPRGDVDSDRAGSGGLSDPAGAPGIAEPAGVPAGVPGVSEPAEVDGQHDPWTDSVLIRGVAVRQGDRVRLHPSRSADVHDLFRDGAAATVAGVFHDLDDEYHVAVTIDEDPAADLYQAQGRFLYFHPDEIEPLAEPEGGSTVPGGQRTLW